jgi:phage terminase large subunit-like protein
MAKTTESAIKAKYFITKDGEQGAQVYACATKEDQATIVVNDAGRIIEASPILRDRFQLFRYKSDIKKVVYAPTNSFIKPLGRDSNTQDGFDPSVGIIDEYHAHPDASLLNVLESGMGMRRQPLIDIITTAGFNQQGPCFKLRKLCIDILEGRKTDDSLLTMIFALDDPERWEDETEWIKANPNMEDVYLRDKIIMPYLRDRYKQAKNEGSSKEVDFKTKNLNIWCDAPEVWIPDDRWAGNTHGIKESDLYGGTCFGGLDLASGIDLNAFALIFPNFTTVAGKQIHPIRVWVFMPADNVNSTRFDYSDFHRAGHIITTPGNIIDHSYMVSFIAEEVAKYNFISGAYDPYLAHHGTIQGLTREGILWHPISQGFRTISTPTKEYERRAWNGEFEHFKNPLLRWMMGNTAIIKDPNDNIKINKGNSINKIDGVAAAINALAESMTVLGGVETNFYAI